VDRDHAQRHARPADVLETRLAHDRGDPFRFGVALHAPDEVPVGAALTDDPPDERDDAIEPDLEEPRDPPLRPRDLEADDAGRPAAPTAPSR
jgi:hypothetical protein